MRTAPFLAVLVAAGVASAAKRIPPPPPDPAIPVYFRDQPVTKALPFRPADYLPGEYSWEPYGRTGTFTIRGRLNREGFQFLSWGGGRRIEPAFVERLGLTAACVHYYDYADELELAKRGLQFCVRMTHWPSFIASDLNADILQNVVREEVKPFADCYAWSMSLMNTERHASGSMPYSLACTSPRWRAFAEKELGFPLPPTNAITATPAHVFPVRTLGELKAQCYLAIGAVAAHGLSFFAADQWQKPNDAVTEADTAAFGEFVRRTLRPAAEVLRDIPTVRAPVAVAQCTEVEYLGGAGWTPRRVWRLRDAGRRRVRPRAPRARRRSVGGMDGLRQSQLRTIVQNDRSAKLVPSWV